MSMKIAAIQMVSTTRVESNLRAADRLLAEAKAQGAELAVLPEYFCLLGASDKDKVLIREAESAPGKEGPLQSFLRDAARSYGLTIVGGTIPLDCGDEAHIFNTTLVYAPSGERLARYDKVHLFRFARGNESYDESRTIKHGDSPVSFNLKDSSGDTWKIGLSICYDLRFPEHYRALSRDGACDLMLVPSAFTYTTGKAHWQTLLRARAIENQCYVLASAQGSGGELKHDNGRQTYGHSLVFDPWGELLAVKDSGEGVVCVEISQSRIAELREQLPALTHRVFL
jgi:deaminated glutathione amidase